MLLPCYWLAPRCKLVLAVMSNQFILRVRSSFSRFLINLFRVRFAPPSQYLAFGKFCGLSLSLSRYDPASQTLQVPFDSFRLFAPHSPLCCEFSSLEAVCPSLPTLLLFSPSQLVHELLHFAIFYRHFRASRPLFSKAHPAGLLHF